MKGDEVTIHYVGEVVDGEMQMVPVYHKRSGGEEAAKHILEAMR